jgi:hypothetical protein
MLPGVASDAHPLMGGVPRDYAAEPVMP